MDPNATLKQICDHLSGSGNFDECLELIESLADWIISGGFQPKPCLYSVDDIVIGAYWYCVDYHSGQWSDEYRVQCKLGKLYSPESSSNDLKTFSDEKARPLYPVVHDSLVALYKETANA